MCLVISLKVINEVKDLKHIVTNILDLTTVGFRCETNLTFWKILHKHKHTRERT